MAEEVGFEPTRPLSRTLRFQGGRRYPVIFRLILPLEFRERFALSHNWFAIRCLTILANGTKSYHHKLEPAPGIEPGSLPYKGSIIAVILSGHLERDNGIEPISLVWKTRVIPLYESRRSEICFPIQLWVEKYVTGDSLLTRWFRMLRKSSMSKETCS